MRSPSPRLAIFSLLDWPNACRWPRPLSDSGFYVESVGHAQDIVHASSRLAQRHVIPPEALSGRPQLQDYLIRLWAEHLPDLILAADDVAVQELDLLHQQIGARPGLLELTRILVRSLGDPGHTRTLRSKHATQELAERLGLRTPGQRVCDHFSEALAFTQDAGFPVVVKQEFNWAGLGVRICRDAEQLTLAWTTLSGQGRLAVQRYIAGQSAMSDATSHAGRLLATSMYCKLNIWPDGIGPSCVVRSVDHPEMLESTRRLAAATGLSGIFSLDFQIDASGQAYLLECNPRPIPTSHLDPRLFQALRRLLPGGSDVVIGQPPIPREIILFPKELRRDPRSSYFATAHHDVPWDEPELIPRLMAHP